MSVEVPDDVIQFLGQCKTLTLATVGGDGKPHAATQVYVNDGTTIYIWSHAGTTTAEHIGDGATVAFAVDEYADDASKTKGIQGTGAASPAGGEDVARAGDLFGSKFPGLRPGASGAVAFFRIEPDELHFVDNSKGDGAPEADEFRRQSFA